MSRLWLCPSDSVYGQVPGDGSLAVKPDGSTSPTDHYAGKDLDSFLVSFHDASVHAHAIANRKRFGIILLLFFLNPIDDLIHNSSPAARLRAHTLIRRHGFCNPKSPII